MAVSTRDIASTLNDLVETNKDAEEGFRNAAENVNDSRLSTIFNECSRERAQMASDLQIEVTRIGGKPQKSGSVAGAVHRGWISIKSTFTGKSDHAILEEAERGEDAAVKAYQNALAEELPTDTAQLYRSSIKRFRRVTPKYDPCATAPMRAGTPDWAATVSQAPERDSMAMLP